MNLFEQFSVQLRNKRWLRHFSFWFGFFLFVMTSLTLKFELNFATNFVWFLIKIVPTLCVTYFLAYFWIPQLLQKNKYVISIVTFILVAYISSAFFRYTTIYIGEPLSIEGHFEQESIQEILTDLRSLFLRYFVSIYYVAATFLFAKYFSQYGTLKEEQLNIEKVKAEGELKALKAQLNPHFLFNTLNNIYSLSIDNSPKTPESIGKLSEILDYLLYRCNEKYVPIKGEVKMLRNYIDLEKLRFDDRLKVSFEVDIQDNLIIAPHIILSLVENAFKHGAGEDSGSPEIIMTLLQHDKKITFEISNTVSQLESHDDREAIGLENIKKQLDILYPGRHSIDIQDTRNTFTVKLDINTLDTV